MIQPDDLDPNAELVAALEAMREETAAAVEQMAAEAPDLFELVRESADALEAYLREQVANSSIPPLAGGQQKAVESPSGRPSS